MIRTAPFLLLAALLPLPLASAHPGYHAECGESDYSTSSEILQVTVDAWVFDCAGAAFHNDGLVCRPPGVHVHRLGAHVFGLGSDWCATGALVELP